MIKTSLVLFTASLAIQATVIFSDGNGGVSVQPDRVPEGSAAEVTLSGKGLPAGSKVALMPGGPYVSRVWSAPERVGALDAAGGRLFLLGESTGLHVTGLDLAKSPFTTGGGDLREESFQAMALGLSRAAVVHDSTRLEIFDLSEPDASAPAGEFRSNSPISRLAFGKDLLYILCDPSYLEVLDVSSPSSPRLISRFGLEATVHRMVTGENRILLAQGDRGLLILETEDPMMRLREAGRYNTTGDALDVAFQQGTAYVADGEGGLTILDVREPGRIRWIGSLSLAGPVTSVRVEGPRALVRTGPSDLVLVDISDPSNPSAISFFHAEGEILAYTYRGGRAYLSVPEAVEVVDFSEEEIPAVMNDAVSFGGARRVAFRDDIAYVADWFSGIHLYDVRDPYHPRLLSSHHTPGSPKGIAVRGDFAFVADDDHGLRIIDVKDPHHPVEISSLSMPGLAYKPVLDGNLLYLAAHRGGFSIIDISDVFHPALIGGERTPGLAWGIAVSGHTAFVADDEAGLLIYDASKPEEPELIGRFNPGGAAEDVQIRGSLAYVVFFDDGLFVLDIRNPARPAVVGHLPTPGNARGLDLFGRNAYVADWKAGLEIVDIGDPSRPVPVGRYDTDGAAWGVAVSNQFAYVMDWWGGFTVLDISAPEQPALAGRYHGTGRTIDVASRGDYAFALNDIQGIQVFDIQNRLNPMWITGLEPPVRSRGLVLESKTAYAALGAEGVWAVDISDPFELRPAATVKTGLSAERIRAGDRRLFISDLKTGVEIIDAAHPTRPTVLGTVPGRITDFWIDRSRLFVTTEDRGLEVLDLTDAARPTPLYHLPTNGTARIIRAAGEIACLYEEGTGIRIVELRPGGYRAVSLLDPGRPVADMEIEGDRLFVATDRPEVLAVDLANPESPEIKAAYPLSSPVRKLAVVDDGLLVAGDLPVRFIKILDGLEASPDATGGMKVRLPGTLLPGAYHLFWTGSDGHRRLLPNAFRVNVPESEKKLSLEEYERLLRERCPQCPR